MNALWTPGNRITLRENGEGLEGPLFRQIQAFCRASLASPQPARRLGDARQWQPAQRHRAPLPRCRAHRQATWIALRCHVVYHAMRHFAVWARRATNALGLAHWRTRSKSCCCSTRQRCGQVGASRRTGRRRPPTFGSMCDTVQTRGGASATLVPFYQQERLAMYLPCTVALAPCHEPRGRSWRSTGVDALRPPRTVWRTSGGASGWRP
jgi:hypothetical protein